MRLLLAEDDATLGSRLKQDLKKSGYTVDWVDNGIDAEFQGKEAEYDAVILDLGLPGRPGLEVLANWRKKNIKTPVIILTARDAWHERVDGLKAGADDYVGKPFHFEELLARLDALLRRSQNRPGQTLTASGLTLNEDTQHVTLESGEATALSAIEFRLLRCLMAHPGKVFSKEQLAEHIYEWETDHDSNVMEAHIKRLRQKIGKDKIETRRGQGYVFVTSGD